KVRRGNSLAACRLQLAYACPPLFKVELRRRHGHTQIGRTRQADAAYIAHKAEVLEEVSEVMIGVSRRIERAKAQIINHNFLLILQHDQMFSWHSKAFAP